MMTKKSNETLADPVEIILHYPLDTLKTLFMRRVKVRDTLAAQRVKGNDAEKEIFLLANLCEVTSEQIESLDMADYTRLQEVYSSFLS